MSERRTPEPKSVGDLLKTILEKKFRRSPLGGEMKIWEQWQRAVGAEVSKHAKPTSFRNGVVYVEVNNAAWLTELQYRTLVLKRKINEALGEELVRELHFFVRRSR